MIDMNIRIFFLLAIAAISLGCTQGGNTANAGADISEFSLDSAQLTDQDTAELTLKVENVGGKTMDGNSKVWIYNVPFSESAWRLESINGDKTDQGIITGGELIETDKFYPRDPATNSPGATIMKDIILLPPGISYGLKRNYEFISRLCYPYRTTTSTNIVAASANEFRASKDTTAAATINSAGPISLALKSDSVVRSAGRIPMPFVVTNIGTGYPTARSAGTDCTDELADTPSHERGILKLNVLVDGEETDCSDETVSLDKSGKAVVWCNYELSTDNPKKEYHITATATYNYFATKSTKTEVTGVLGETGLPGGGAGGGGVVVATLVKSLCEKAGQKYDTNAIPACVDKSMASESPDSFPYPGTTVQVLAQPPACQKTFDVNYLNKCESDPNRAKILKDALGSRYESATIKTLNTHDLKAKDLKLGDLTLSDIDSWLISSQYTKSMLTDKEYALCTDTAKCKEKNVPYVKPLGITDALCSGCTNVELKLVLKSDPLKEIIKKTVTHKKADDKKLSDYEINGMSATLFLDKPIYGLKITEIGGKKISDMTKDTAKISEINLESFYLKYLLQGDEMNYPTRLIEDDQTTELAKGDGIIASNLYTDVKHDASFDTSLLGHIKCESTTKYTATTHAFCVTAVEAYKGQSVPLPKFSSTSSTECSTKCKSFGATYLGACNSADKKDKYECNGRNIIVYGLDITATTAKKYGCSNQCLCYRTDKGGLTSAESMLLCK